jgi:hypothetical protein
MDFHMKFFVFLGGYPAGYGGGYGGYGGGYGGFGKKK